MMTSSIAPVRRPSLSVVVEGLAPRDELLLKSMVRLLDHRTCHQWLFNAARCDLKIQGENADPAAIASSEASMPAATLRAGRVISSPHRYDITLPLHAGELERTLNRVGADIVEARRAEAVRPPVSADDTHAFQLTRWPPSALLREPAHLPLATLLISRPCTVSQLHLRSGAEPSVCVAFLNELQRVGLLKSTEVDPVMVSTTRTVAVPQSGLFARIRRRLGLASSTAT